MVTRLIRDHFGARMGRRFNSGSRELTRTRVEVARVRVGAHLRTYWSTDSFRFARGYAGAHRGLRVYLVFSWVHSGARSGRCVHSGSPRIIWTRGGVYRIIRVRFGSLGGA